MEKDKRKCRKCRGDIRGELTHKINDDMQVFEDHTHYVMSIAINPKDPNIFATASLDRTIKVFKFIHHLFE